MVYLWLRKSKVITLTPLVLVILALLFAVACGSAAAPETSAPDTSAPDTTAPDTSAPDTTAPDTSAPDTTAPDTSAPAPSETGETSAPTAVPAAVSEPEEVMVAVNPGKVTWMMGGWGNERFDYAFTPGGDPSQYGRIMHGFLLEISDDFKLVPGIATDWGLSTDGLTWDFTIREGAKFHDGTEVTAEDVLWTWQHNFGPGAEEYVLGTAVKPLIRLRDRIEAGPDNVSVTTTIPFTSIPDYFFSRRGPLFLGVLPRRDQQHDEAAEAAYEKNPIGAGVMKLAKHVPLEVMEFERFDDYYYQPEYGFPEDRRVNFTSFDLRVVPEEATRVAAIRAGEADIAPVSLQSKKQVEAGDGRLIFGREGVYFNLILEMCWSDAQLLCHDKRVRQAMAYAIDKELIRDELYGAEVMEIKGWSYISPSTIGYSPEVDPFPFDPDKARQLMAEAGYKTPTSSQGKDPGKFIINAIVATSLPMVPEAAQLIGSMWEKELGIDVEVAIGDRTALKKLEQAGDLAGQLYFRDNETRVQALSNMQSQYGNAERKHRRQNDPAVFDWINEIIAITDPATQAEEANKLYRHLRDEQNEIGIGYVNIPWAVGPRIESWQPRPLNLYPSAMHTIVLK